MDESERVLDVVVGEEVATYFRIKARSSRI